MLSEVLYIARAMEMVMLFEIAVRSVSFLIPYTIKLSDHLLAPASVKYSSTHVLAEYLDKLSSTNYFDVPYPMILPFLFYIYITQMQPRQKHYQRRLMSHHQQRLLLQLLMDVQVFPLPQVNLRRRCTLFGFQAV